METTQADKVVIPLDTAEGRTKLAKAMTEEIANAIWKKAFASKRVMSSHTKDPKEE